MRGNTVSLKGNITRDAEIRRTQSGRIVASWGIAWNRSRKNQQGEYEDVPYYFDVECWLTDKQLRLLEPSLVKGARCAIIDGHLEYQTWESNGQKRSKVLVSVDDPVNGLLVSAATQTKKEQPASVYDEDVPF